MSLQQQGVAFAFGQGMDHPFGYGMPTPASDNGTVNLIDLHFSQPDHLPAQLPLFLGSNPQGPEIRDTVLQEQNDFRFWSSTQANPPANFAARQGAAYTEVEPLLHQNMAFWNTESLQGMVNPLTEVPVQLGAFYTQAQQPLPQDTALWPTESQPGFDDLLSSPANPPAELPAWQGATTIPVQYQLHQNMAAQQPEILFDRTMIPVYSAGVFPAAEGGTGAGPQPLFHTVGPETRARMERGAQQLKEKAMLGPRKRKAEEAVDAEPVGNPKAKSRRPGPPKADPGKPSRTSCFHQHQRCCDIAVGCQENCLLKTEYPDYWKKKADETRYYVVDGASYTTSDLWIWMWEDSNRREKKGRAAKN